MGKQGPCCHCGVTSTPLWRNGPPEKPVLCNACGSRWRTKGTLVNYTPLHARADLDNYEDHRVSRMKSISLNKNKDAKPLKRKPNHDNVAIGGFFPDYNNHGYRKVIDEDASNRSSSGSAISNSESCAQFGSADASDLTGQAQSNVWETLVPSKKRTCVNRLKQSSFEKLTKDLYTIWHEQQSSSCFSGSSEEELLFESEGPMVSVEIGHGSVLIRHPSSIARDEESEASSLSVDNKVYVMNEAYSNSVAFPVHNENKNVNIPSHGIEKAKNPAGQWMLQEQLKRDKSQYERADYLANHNSPLCDVDLNDILNFEEFARCLTNEEQQRLLKYLPPIDNARLPDSIKSMFDSPQFKDNVACYQQLLGEGVFDLSFAGSKTEDCNTLKRLTLSNFSKSKWVEFYHRFKKCKNSTGKSKGSCDNQSQKIPEVKMRSPKRVTTKAAYENKEMESDGSCFSPRSLFALPPNRGSFMLDSIQYEDENSEQDLLLDVPCNGSFAQAELLRPPLTIGQLPQASTGSSSTYPNLFYP